MGVKEKDKMEKKRDKDGEENDSGKKININVHLIYISVIALLILLCVVLFLTKSTTTNTSISTDETVQSVSFNFIITVLVSVICSILAGQIISVFMAKEEKKERVSFVEDIVNATDKAFNSKKDDVVSEMTEQVSQIYNASMGMSPVRVYASTEQPDQSFNTELNRGILNSDFFCYYGESGRYTCIRLNKLKEESEKSLSGLRVKVLLPNPTISNLFEDNIRFLVAKAQNQRFREQNAEENEKVEQKSDWLIEQGVNQSEEMKENQTSSQKDGAHEKVAPQTAIGLGESEIKIIKEAKEKVIKCLYALFSMRYDFYSIDVYLLDEIPAISVEMTDNLIYLEFYRTRSESKKYPVTLAYGTNNVYYEAYKIYLEWIETRGGVQHINMSKANVSDILQLASDAGLGKITEENLKEQVLEMMKG